MGFFDSKSESLTQGAETGQQVETGQAFSVSNIETGKKSNVTINAEVTDLDAVRGGLQLADRSLERATAVVDDAIRASGASTELAIQSSDAARRDALEFGAGALELVASAEADAFNASRALVADSQEAAYQFAGEALEVSEAARVDSLEFGAQAVDAIGEFSGAAIDRFLAASKSESAQLSDNVLGFAKVAVIAVGLVLAIGAFR